MTVTPYDEPPSSPSSLAPQPELPDGRPHGDDRKERAVTQLLEHGVLSHVFGRHGEYKVRTTMTTRPSWQYRCSVLRYGKAIKKAFFPIIVERMPPMPQARLKFGDAEDLRLSFAQEAVDVHFTRCAALHEYLVLAAIYDQPPSQFRQWYILLLALPISIAVVSVYGFWTYVPRTNSIEQLAGPPASIAERHDMGKPSSIPLPTSNGMARRNGVEEQLATSHLSHPAEAPITVSLNDLLDGESPLAGPSHTSRALVPQSSLGVTTSDVQVGDVLLLTGWVHRVSRTPDNTYRLHVSSDRNAASRHLIAMVPPPDQAPGSPDVKVQLQTARTFIKGQLLQHKEPSPRGSVMQRPPFVQLTGRLSYPDAAPGQPARGKRSQDATAHWQIRPVLEVQFATPPMPPARSQPQ